MKVVALIWYLKMVRWVNDSQKCETNEEPLCGVVFELDVSLLHWMW